MVFSGVDLYNVRVNNFYGKNLVMIQGDSKQIFTAINDNNQILIFHHLRPDGDCLGAGYGLRALLRLNYPQKEVLFLAENYPGFSFMNFCPDFWPNHNWKVNQQSLAIVVDSGDQNRIYQLELLLNQTTKRARIDHHYGVADLDYDYLFVDPSYPACCLQIAQLAYQFGWKINQEIVRYLLLGIITDTGRFNYGKLSSSAFNLIAWMLETTNFDYFQIALQLNFKSFNDLKYQAYVYQHYQVSQQVAWHVVFKDTAQQFQITDNTAAQVGILAGLIDCPIWVFFIEQPSGNYRARLRSRQFNVRLVAEQFGGGGHDLAASCYVNADQINQLINKLNETPKINY